MFRFCVVSVLALFAVGDNAVDAEYMSLLQTKAQMLTANKEVNAEAEEVAIPDLALWAKRAHEFERRKHAKAQAAANRAKQVSGAASGGAVRLIDFTLATLVYNNLGGQGPVKFLSTGEPAPQEIRYRNLVRGSAVDFVVTAAPGYQAHNPSRNGILLGNGQVNAKSGTSAELTFKFVNEGTNIPYTMPLFYITFSDLDERHGGVEKEKIQVSGFDTYYTNDDLALVSGGSDESSATFQSSDYGNYTDNAFYADSPSPPQLSHAVTFKFTNKASFSATFMIEEHRDMHEGRNVLFSGISQLVFCQEPSVYLDFAKSAVTTNNLGGKGPGTGTEELRWSGIATTEAGQVLDLIAVADSDYGYQPWNVSQNGLHGDFGHINLFCGPSKSASEAYITFKIVETGTWNVVVLPQFAFVIFDFDQGLHEQQVEYVEIGPNQPGFDGGVGYSSYIVTSTTELEITNAEDAGKMHFAATKHGTEADNPTSAQNLARETADKSVVFTFRKTGEFKITLGITATGQDTGRNFMFSGQDMYLMCD